MDDDINRVIRGRRRTDQMHRRESDQYELTSVTVEETIEERRRKHMQRIEADLRLVVTETHRPYVTEQQLHDDLKVKKPVPNPYLNKASPPFWTRILAWLNGDVV